MSGEKDIHIFDPKYFGTPRVSFYGLEAILMKLVGQPEKRATAQYDCVPYILVRGLVKSLGLHSKK